MKKMLDKYKKMDYNKYTIQEVGLIVNHTKPNEQEKNYESI